MNAGHPMAAATHPGLANTETGHHPCLLTRGRHRPARGSFLPLPSHALWWLLGTSVRIVDEFALDCFIFLGAVAFADEGIQEHGGKTVDRAPLVRTQECLQKCWVVWKVTRFIDARNSQTGYNPRTAFQLPNQVIAIGVRPAINIFDLHLVGCWHTLDIQILSTTPKYMVY